MPCSTTPRACRTPRRCSRRALVSTMTCAAMARPSSAAVPPVPAASYELALTDKDFKFPQVLRTNLAVDHRFASGWRGTLEFLWGRDVNGVYYINANLPAAD